MFTSSGTELWRAAFLIAVITACHTGCDDETDELPTGTGTPSGSGGASTGTGGTAAGGTGGTASGGTGTAAPGGSGGSGGAAGMGGAGGGAGSGGNLGACPASGPFDLTVWDTNPWVVPMSGSTLQTISLSNEIGLHYEQFEMDFDMTTAQIGTPFVCFAELRNQTGNHSVAWRYFALCVRTDSSKQLVNHVFTPSTGRVVTTFTIQPSTAYHVNYVFDARNSSATATITESGGPSVSATSTPITSSISPQGSGLKLLMGISETHPDVLAGNIAPPRGWSFENLIIHLDPGGPFGSEALPCP